MNKQKFQFNYANALATRMDSEDIKSEGTEVANESEEKDIDNPDPYSVEIDILKKANLRQEDMIREQSEEIRSLRNSLDLKNDEYVTLNEKYNEVVNELTQCRSELLKQQQCSDRIISLYSDLKKARECFETAFEEYYDLTSGESE